MMTRVACPRILCDTILTFITLNNHSTTLCTRYRPTNEIITTANRNLWKKARGNIKQNPS